MNIKDIMLKNVVDIFTIHLNSHSFHYFPTPSPIGNEKKLKLFFKYFYTDTYILLIYILYHTNNYLKIT